MRIILERILRELKEFIHRINTEQLFHLLFARPPPAIGKEALLAPLLITWKPPQSLFQQGLERHHRLLPCLLLSQIPCCP